MKIKILTYRDLTAVGQLTVGSLHLTDFNTQYSVRYDSDYIIYVNNGTITTLKDRTNKLSKTEGRYKEEYYETLTLGKVAKKLQPRQHSYLIELLETSDILEISNDKLFLIARVLKQGWYGGPDIHRLNYIRKTYVNNITYGKFTQVDSTYIVQGNLKIGAV